MLAIRISALFLCVIVTRYYGYGQYVVSLNPWRWNDFRATRGDRRIVVPLQTPARNPFLQFYPRRTTTPAPTPSWEEIVAKIIYWDFIYRILSRRQTTSTQKIPSTDTPELASSPPVPINTVGTNAPHTTSTRTDAPQQGYWLEWTGWSLCNALQCGERSRSRVCAGTGCDGEDGETEACNVDATCLLAPGTWSIWSSWTICSLDRDQCALTQSRSRTCDDGCLGSSRQTQSCIGTFLYYLHNENTCYTLVDGGGGMTYGDADGACSIVVSGSLGIVHDIDHFNWVVSLTRMAYPTQSTFTWTDDKYDHANSQFDTSSVTGVWYDDKPPVLADGIHVVVGVTPDGDATATGFKVTTASEETQFVLCQL